MNYQKKVLLLKQVNSPSDNTKPLSAIARTEIEDGSATFFMSTLNAKYIADTTYFAFLLDCGEKLFCFDLGARPSSHCIAFESLPDITKGACIGIFTVWENIPELVAFGKSPECDFDSVKLKKRVAEYFIKQSKQEKQKPRYDDEAVATVNYFSEQAEVENVSNEDRIDAFCSKEETQKDDESNDCLPYATNAFESQKPSQDTYFDRSREELAEIFEKFEHVVELERLFPDSKFAKINYSNGKYYVVGLVCEKGKEKYVCYGVPGKYSEQAPKELAPYCTFIPLSVFNLSGEGFWMMFQDAQTGICISTNNKKN